MRNFTGLKILLLTFCILLTVAIILFVTILKGDYGPEYEDVDINYTPVAELTPEPSPTPTPTPTPTPEPSPEPEEPTVDEDGFLLCEKTITVNTNELNVRSGPGTDYSKLGTLDAGDTVTCTGTNEDGWCRILFEGETAYVSADYVSE